MATSGFNLKPPTCKGDTKAFQELYRRSHTFEEGSLKIYEGSLTSREHEQGYSYNKHKPCPRYKLSSCYFTRETVLNGSLQYIVFVFSSKLLDKTNKISTIHYFYSVFLLFIFLLLMAG